LIHDWEEAVRDTGRRLCLLAIFLSAALVRVSRGLSVRIQSGSPGFHEREKGPLHGCG